MENQVNVYPPGSAIIMTSGEYSDFYINAVLVTIKRCDMPALVREFCETAPEKREGAEGVAPESFPSWLVAQGHCFPADTQELHLGNFDAFDRNLIEFRDYKEIMRRRFTLSPSDKR